MIRYTQHVSFYSTSHDMHAAGCRCRLWTWIEQWEQGTHQGSPESSVQQPQFYHPWFESLHFFLSRFAIMSLFFVSEWLRKRTCRSSKWCGNEFDHAGVYLATVVSLSQEKWFYKSLTLVFTSDAFLSKYRNLISGSTSGEWCTSHSRPGADSVLCP